MRRYKASIIGLGRVAWLLERDPLETKPCTHMGAYSALDSVEVTSGADIDTQRLDDFAATYKTTKLYNYYADMLESESPDIVSICGYATERCDMLLDVIESGVKGIWCEKALATNLIEADKMLNVARGAGVAVIVSHMRRWQGEYILAKTLIDDGEIGELTSITAYFSGSLLHTGTHAFDILSWFAGKPVAVEGYLESVRGSADIGGRAFIEFDSGIYASVVADSLGYFLFEFDIIGTKGRIRIGNNGLLDLYKSAHSRHYTGFKELENIGFPQYKEGNGWINAAKNLVAVMEGRQASISGLYEARIALEMALAIHKSDSMGGERVKLPLEDRAFSVENR